MAQPLYSGCAITFYMLFFSLPRELTNIVNPSAITISPEHRYTT